MRTTIIRLAAAAVAAVAVASASASGSQRWSDPRDDATTAPDVTDVSATSTDAGQITFTVAFANRTTLEADDDVDIIIDADRQTGTGNKHGVDYLVGVHGLTPFVARWDAAKSKFATANAPSYQYAWANSTATFTIDRRDLGMTSGFDFYVETWDTSADEPFDMAPDGDDWWGYRLNLPFALRIVSTQFDLSDVPKAGKSFTLGTHVVRDDTGETLHDGAIVCKASIAGRPVKQSRKPMFFQILVSNGAADMTQALCNWALPRSAKGKTVSATITVSLQGQSVTRTYTGTVR